MRNKGINPIFSISEVKHLADYFERQAIEVQYVNGKPTYKCGWVRKQFLKDCGIEKT